MPSRQNENFRLLGATGRQMRPIMKVKSQESSWNQFFRSRNHWFLPAFSWAVARKSELPGAEVEDSCHQTKKNIRQPAD